MFYFEYGKWYWVAPFHCKTHCLILLSSLQNAIVYISIKEIYEKKKKKQQQKLRWRNAVNFSDGKVTVQLVFALNAADH